MKNKNIKNKYVLLILSVLLLTACATGKDGHTYVKGHCVTCLNNPVTGEPYNYSKSSEDYEQAGNYKAETGGSSSAAVEIPYEEGRVKFSVRNRVDQAYLKLKREFGFKTRQERLRGFGYNEKAWLDSADEFRYEALPGVSYHMREYTGHIYRGKSQEHTIDMLLESNGLGTDIIVTYWVQKPKSALQNYGNSIKSRVIKVLR